MVVENSWDGTAIINPINTPSITWLFIGLSGQIIILHHAVGPGFNWTKGSQISCQIVFVIKYFSQIEILAEIIIQYLSNLNFPEIWAFPF